MSRGFVKEGDQEEVPMVLPRAFLPKGIPNYVTPEGLKQRRDEMESMRKEWTDAGSNYVTKNYIDAKMRLLSERINTAVLIDPAKANPDVVSFGMFVKYNNKIIRIVGVDEADASKGLVSFISPIAKSLIGKRKGDKFEIKVPKGTEIIEVQEVAVSISSELRAMGNEQSAENNEREALKKTVVNANVQILETPLEETISDLSDSHVSDLSDFKIQKVALLPNALGIGVTSFWSETEKDIAESPTASPERPKKVKSQSSLSESNSASSFNHKVDITEFLPLVNEQGNIVGRALYCEIHNGNKVLHPAVHLLVYNSKKEIVAKYWWHVAFGETAEKTMKRKIDEIKSHEETSGRMSVLKPKFKKQYIREDKNEKELVSVFTVTFDGAVMPTPQSKEWDEIFRNS